MPWDTDLPLRYSTTKVATLTTRSVALLPTRFVLVLDLRRVLPSQLSPHIVVSHLGCQGLRGLPC